MKTLFEELAEIIEKHEEEYDKENKTIILIDATDEGYKVCAEGDIACAMTALTMYLGSMIGEGSSKMEAVEEIVKATSDTIEANAKMTFMKKHPNKDDLKQVIKDLLKELMEDDDEDN